MTGPSVSEQNLLNAYQTKFARSAELYDRALKVIAGGVTHDSRAIHPFPVAIHRAAGPLKWDVSGNQLIDYWMGHGALLLGHCFEPVVEAVRKQLELGSHFGASHELETRWAELICELIPSAERVRFTSSGTEAVILALRIARAWTGRHIVLRLNGHFHGWHDEAMSHFVAAEDGGLSPGSEEYVGLADPLSIEAIAGFLSKYEVAGLILEPGGAGSGALPYDPEFLARLRDLTRQHRALLIFDEVISGFRYSPGGVQALSGIMPDLTLLSKILGGGLPGGAVAGPAEIMSVFGEGVSTGGRHAKVQHSGTFNANPLSAAAGICMLQHVSDGAVQTFAKSAAEKLVKLVNEFAEARGVDISCFNNSSTFHVVVGGRKAGVEGPSKPVISLFREKKELHNRLRLALLIEGVDMHSAHGWISAAHDDEVIVRTAEAFDRAFQRLVDIPQFAM